MKKRLFFNVIRLFGIGVLFVLWSGTSFAADATLYLSPITGTYTVGTTIPIRVMVSSGGEAVNAIEGVLTYDPKEIEITGVSKENSALTSWTVEPAYDNATGMLAFGGLLATSTALDHVSVVTLTAQAKRSGEIRVRFASGAAIHAGDGTGGNILSILSGGIYVVIPKEGDLLPVPDSASTTDATTTATSSGEVLGAATTTAVVTSPTHPDQDAWYALATSTLDWDLPDGVARTYLAIDKKQNGEGRVPYEAPLHEKILKNIKDGAWYVHVTREFADMHTDTTDYRLQVDTTPPQNVSVTAKPRTDATDPNATLVLSATDTTSGVEHYEIILDQEDLVSWSDDGTHEYHAHAVAPGAHDVLVRAVDRAGNKTEAHAQFTVEYLTPPTLAPPTSALGEGAKLLVTAGSVPGGIMTFTIAHGGQSANEELTLDATGKGVFTSATPLSPGNYDIAATVRDTRGGLSRESEHLHLEIKPSLMGVVTRHKMIPVIALASLVFLSGMYVFWKKLRASHGAHDDAEEEYAEDDPAPHHESPARPETHSGVIVLAPLHAQKNHAGGGHLSIGRG